jgi:hypothetical protein
MSGEPLRARSVCRTGESRRKYRSRRFVPRLWAKFAITMRHRGKEHASDIELPSRAIEVLAYEAMSRDLDIAELIGQALVAAINKDMIQKILR